MTPRELEARTKRFALDVIEFTGSVPRVPACTVMSRQLLRAGTAIGSLYREAVRAESRNDFIHKVSVAAKEASETEYWLELFSDTNYGDRKLLKHLRKEVDELLRILIASAKTAKRPRP